MTQSRHNGDAPPTPPMAGRPTRVASSSPARYSQPDAVGASSQLVRQRRQETIASEVSAPSVADRLSRMRLEDRRRARNEEMRRLKQSSSSSSASSSSSPALLRHLLRPDAPAFEPVAGSASSRAGTQYLAAAQLSQQDMRQAQQDHALRRAFAGPAPPDSWRAHSTQNACMVEGGYGPAAANGRGQQRRLSSAPLIDRRHALRALRRFFPSNSTFSQDEQAEESEEGKRLMSLVDVSLSALCTYLCEPEDVAGGSKQSLRTKAILRSQARYLPMHLKERALALAGRLAKVAPIEEKAIRLLFAREGDEEELKNDLGRGQDADEKEDQLHNLPEAWDEEQFDRSFDRRSSSEPRCVHLDLSFASISAVSIRTLVKSMAVNGSHLRALSLAGWGYGADALQGRTRKCLRTSASLFSVLDQLSNLQALSLASTRLLPSEDDDEAQWRGRAEGGARSVSPRLAVSADSASEALAFLKKLARRTTQLTVLDMSGCQWVNGAVIANTGWHSTSMPVRRLAWPRLQHLILVDCAAFSGSETKAPVQTRQVTDDWLKRESGSFAATWHAAHHGLVRATSSPYFLGHRPGLGRALLAHGVGGAWDSVSGRHSLVEREAAALRRHNAHFRRSAAEDAVAALEARRRASAPVRRSAFDDDNTDDELLHYTLAGAPSPRAGFAISHGVAPFAGRARHAAFLDTPSTSVPPRCPVSKEHVPQHEWERARVLDAVRGRWGSAILGNIDDNSNDDDKGRSANGAAGEFITVYF